MPYNIFSIGHSKAVSLFRFLCLFVLFVSQCYFIMSFPIIQPLSGALRGLSSTIMDFPCYPHIYVLVVSEAIIVQEERLPKMMNFSSYIYLYMWLHLTIKPKLHLSSLVANDIAMCSYLNKCRDVGSPAFTARKYLSKETKYTSSVHALMPSVLFCLTLWTDLFSRTSNLDVQELPVYFLMVFLLQKILCKMSKMYTLIRRLILWYNLSLNCLALST